MKKRLLFLYFFIAIILVFLFLLFWGNKTIRVVLSSSDVIGVFYKDTVNVDLLFPQYRDWDYHVDNNRVCVRNRIFYLSNPDSISVSDLHTYIIFKKGASSEKREVHFRCWKECFDELDEITTGKLWRGSKLYLLTKYIESKVWYKGKKSVVACGDSLYFFNRGEIIMEYKGKRTLLKSKIPLETSEYNQMIKGGGFLFFRNGSKLYLTQDNFNSYKLIYDDRRGIKESMVWDDQTQRLLFTMYTPGAVRLRHYLLAYTPRKDKIDTLQTFYSSEERNKYKLSCRHIHFISKDPYTGHIYIGVGDFNNEPAIYITKDGGESIHCLGKGSQMWRSLSVFYQKDYIYWTTDTDSPQYIFRISREALEKLPVVEDSISCYPLINSALWCNVSVNDSTYYLGSNSEGCYYDSFHRIYKLVFSSDGIPQVSAVFEEKSLPEKRSGVRYHQTSPLCIDSNGHLWCYDSHLGVRVFQIGGMH